MYPILGLDTEVHKLELDEEGLSGSEDSESPDTLRSLVEGCGFNAAPRGVAMPDQAIRESGTRSPEIVQRRESGFGILTSIS